MGDVLILNGEAVILIPEKTVSTGVDAGITLKQLPLTDLGWENPFHAF